MNIPTRSVWLLLIAASLLVSVAFGAPAQAQSGASPRQQDAGFQHPLTCQYRQIRHEVVDEVAVSVLERVGPLPETIEYRVVVWIDDSEQRVWKIELRDDRGRLAYIVRYLSYEREAGEWVPAAIYVRDQGRSETRVVRKLPEVGGIDLDEVRTAAVGCASLD